jgi:4-amino-4-deoxy-L-arabinose transferase-like glycosyltransferase
VSTTGQESQAPLVSPATVAEWRRRQEASSEALPAAADGEQHANGFQASDHAAVNGSKDHAAVNGSKDHAAVNGSKDHAAVNGSKDHAAVNGSKDHAAVNGSKDHAAVNGSNGHLAMNGSTETADRRFAETQQAGITAMVGFARLNGVAITQPLPVTTEPPATPRTQALSAGPAAPAPIIIEPPVIDRSGLPLRPALVPPGQVPTTRARPSPKRRAIWGSRIAARVPALPIACIIAVQAILSLRLIWSNTAFQDEALYLWAGRVEWAKWLHGAAPSQNLYNPFSAYFSGSPVVYPPLGALANSIGGLAGARILSLCFMLATTGLLYGATFRLFGRRAALFAAALFVATGSTQFLGALATYDAMALMLLALATWLGVRAADCGTGARIALLVTGGAALALADAAKYASALFNPVVIAVTALAIWRARDGKRGIAAAAIMLAVLCGLLLIGLRFGGPANWQGVRFTTLTRSAGTSPVPGVLYVSGTWVGAVAVLAVLGAVTAGYASCRAQRALAWILAGAVFLAPVEQARIHTVTSLFKHVDFGAWFGCIIAGYALAALARAVPAAKASAAGIVSSCAVLLAAIAGVSIASSHFAGWPNSSKMISVIQPVITKTGCPCLLASDNLIDYYLPEQTWQDQLTTVYYFRYPDSADGQMVHGALAYEQAIAAHYFRLVEIDPSENAAVYRPVTRALAVTRGYKLIDTTASNVADEPFEIWVYSPPRSPKPPQRHVRPRRHGHLRRHRAVK